MERFNVGDVVLYDKWDLFVAGDPWHDELQETSVCRIIDYSLECRNVVPWFCPSGRNYRGSGTIYPVSERPELEARRRRAIALNAARKRLDVMSTEELEAFVNG